MSTFDKLEIGDTVTIDISELPRVKNERRSDEPKELPPGELLVAQIRKDEVAICLEPGQRSYFVPISWVRKKT